MVFVTVGDTKVYFGSGFFQILKANSFPLLQAWKGCPDVWRGSRTQMEWGRVDGGVRRGDAAPERKKEGETEGQWGHPPALDQLGTPLGAGFEGIEVRGRK